LRGGCRETGEKEQGYCDTDFVSKLKPKDTHVPVNAKQSAPEIENSVSARWSQRTRFSGSTAPMGTDVRHWFSQFLAAPFR